MRFHVILKWLLQLARACSSLGAANIIYWHRPYCNGQPLRVVRHFGPQRVLQLTCERVTVAAPNATIGRDHRVYVHTRARRPVIFAETRYAMPARDPPEPYVEIRKLDSFQSLLHLSFLAQVGRPL
jgi:hypothetical protein